MIKFVLKYIFITFLISSLFAISYWYFYVPTINAECMGDGSRDTFLLVIISCLGLIHLGLSIAAFFNLKKNFRKKVYRVFISYTGLHLLLLLTLITIYLINKSEKETLSDFLTLGTTSISNVVISFLFFLKDQKQHDFE